MIGIILFHLLHPPSNIFSERLKLDCLLFLTSKYERIHPKKPRAYRWGAVLSIELGH
jgi:hypothetical protein